MRAVLAGAALLAALAQPCALRGQDPPPSGPPAPVPSPGVVRVSLLGGLALGSARFAQARSFTEFAEQGRIDTRYEQDPGPGFEVAGSWRFARRLGLLAAVSLARRKEAGSFSATLPHPLFFGTPRQAEGDFAGRSQKETAFHLDLAVLGGSGRLQWTAFAGPSLISVRTDLVEKVDYTHTYPYDTVTVTGTPFAAIRGRALGFNVGAGLAWQAARHVAIATQVRFARAHVDLEEAADGPLDVEAGGASFTGGIRLDF